jgi:hypothetical protein
MLSLCLIKHLRHEGVWWSGYIGLHFLDLWTGWRWVVSFTHPGRFTPGTHWKGGWVGPRTGPDDVENILDPTGTRTPTVVQPVASRYTGTVRLTDNNTQKHLWRWRGIHGRHFGSLPNKTLTLPPQNLMFVWRQYVLHDMAIELKHIARPNISCLRMFCTDACQVGAGEYTPTGIKSTLVAICTTSLFCCSQFEA